MAHHDAVAVSAGVGPPGVAVGVVVWRSLVLAVFPFEVASVRAEAGPLGVAVGIVVVWWLLVLAVFPFEVASVRAEAVGLPGIAVVIVVAWLPHERAALPEISAEPLEATVEVAVGVANPGHPTFVASPNACFFPSYSSSVALAGAVCAGSSMDVLPNDDPCSHFSTLMVSPYKKTGPFDSIPNLSYTAVIDTSALPTGATTNHCKNIYPHSSQGQHRRTFEG